MLRLSFQASRRLSLLLLLLHAAAILSLLSVPLPFGPRLCLISLAVLSCGLHCANHALRRLPWSIVSAQITSDGAIVLQLRGGQLQEGRILEGSFVAPWLTLVRCKIDGAWWPRVLLIVPDMLPAGTFRQLRVWLKWRRPQAQCVI